MKLKTITNFVVLLCPFFIIAQEVSLSTLTLKPELTKNANAVIRSNAVVVDLNDYNDMTIHVKRIITVLNENGLKHVDAYVQYDPSIKVKDISAEIFNKMGNEIKRFKRKDFKDYSNSGSNLFSDNRVVALDFTPTTYPFTMVFEYEIQTNSTAFIPRWFPIENYYLSSEQSTFIINNYQNLDLTIKEFNLESDAIENLSTPGKIYYKATDLQAYQWEAMSPYFSTIMPGVMVAPKKFKLVDIDGHAENWEDFGLWNYNNLIKGTTDIPASTKLAIYNLVKDVQDPMEKAKRIYEYVQNKTRYISIQLGVGGWKPIPAAKVDEVSYGDCKALTNYTKALMESQGIEANYTVVYGDHDIRDIRKDFVAMQGNHVILQLPNDGDPVWLECTSQKVPFGHIANFTDDRDVFVITPEGGKIEHTKIYSNAENHLTSEASIQLDSVGNLSGEITIKSGGVQYDDRSHLVDADSKDRDVYYKKYWDYINGLSLDNVVIQHDKDAIELSERLAITVKNYGVRAGNKAIINPNVFNRSLSVPPRYTSRKLPLSIQRGFVDVDSYDIQFPDTHIVETMPTDIEINSKFGTYKSTFKLGEDNDITYQRRLEINKGQFAKEDYKDYRNFIRKITKADKSAIVLVKK